MELSRFLNLSLSVFAPFALRCAAELKISDRIHAYHQHAMPLDELTRSIAIAPEKAPMLGQVMRLLVHLGIFAQSEEGYMLTPVSELMLSNGSNMGAFIRLLTDPQLVDPFAVMGPWFMTSTRDSVYQMKNEGKSLWESAKEKPEFGNLFNEGMASHSRKVLKDIVTTCPQLFEGLKSLVDVGGGTGVTVQIIAETFPKLRCTVFDLPNVISNATKSNLFNAAGGDMFEKIPAADAILLKCVLHDWPDEDCIKILGKCREAVPAGEGGGKIIIIELTTDLETHDRMATETSLCFDLAMMVGFAAKERSRKEWHNVFQAAGFVDYKVHAVGVYSIYELFP